MPSSRSCSRAHTTKKSRRRMPRTRSRTNARSWGSDMKTTLNIALVTIALVACGHTPTPNELVEARAAYGRASSGQTNELQPAQVYEAKQALDKAEASFNSDPGSQTV